MPPLQLFLYRAPPKPIPTGPAVQVLSRQLATCKAQGVESNQMDCSFEQAVLQLAQLPQLFVEPDGSFVWNGIATEPQTGDIQHWQLDGMLYDVGDRLNRVELRGSCPLKPWQKLCRCFQPDGELIAYLLDHQCFVLVQDLDCLWS